MSAFSALFGNAKKDEALEILLSQTAGPVERPIRSRTLLSLPDEESIDFRKDKDDSEEEELFKEQESEGEKSDSRTDGSSKPVSAKKAKKRARELKVNESLETDHLAKFSGTKKAKKLKKDASDSNSDEDSEQTKESAPDLKSKKASVAVSVDLKAEELKKAARTVFVGNVSNKVITSKTTYKKFKDVFSEIGPVESVRFRSIAFAGALSRKVAYLKKALHESRDTVNAYVVFKDKEPSRKAPGLLNATTFEDFHIRVDHVAHPSPRDTKRFIFVGNLDFLEQEETLWKYFNEHTGGEVEAVRIVRDGKTNLGKGFALVQFKDSLSVNKALLLNDKPIDTNDEKKGRKIRITRGKAHAKPSIISPNHYINQKKVKKPAEPLSEVQETKLGRAKRMLGKADRSTVGQLVVEGTRARHGLKIAGIKGLKSAQGRTKKPRITERSKQFKEDRTKFKNFK
ncbi:RNA-binding domain-containing protein [Metschnikowia bicuspidata]|uniref:Nucleolar protein 12 n=1 Tax=Metschnikowia bicuspidata TaxID=27322 RepID=A0A4P9ZJR8_9ASCO|nr:RNA-binding domain-containing protein [Metschnikowia bicuspidata]